MNVFTNAHERETENKRIIQIKTSQYSLTMRSNLKSARHALYVGTLHVGHSLLCLDKLCLIHVPQNLWPHSMLTSVSTQGCKQIRQMKSSLMIFLIDERMVESVAIVEGFLVYVIEC